MTTPDLTAHLARRPAPYLPDALAAFNALRAGRENVLLESADIQSKAHLKSLLLLAPALRLTCWGQSVRAEALTEAGKRALELLRGELPAELQAGGGADAATFTFPPPPAGLSEGERLQARSNLEPLRVLQRGLEGAGAAPLLMGVFAFDLLETFENLPAAKVGENTCPDYRFYLAETLLTFDHEAETGELLHLDGNEAALDKLAAQLPNLPTPALPAAEAPADLSGVEVQPSDVDFAAQVVRLRGHIEAGDIYQVVPSRRFSLPCADALAAYRALKQSNPSPYMFYLGAGDFELFGASPESALKFTASSRQVEVYPIAGTRPRGRDAQGRLCPERDLRQEAELRLDRKELSEHLMLVDLARNDVARVSVAGTRRVAELLQVDRYSQVMHLVSRVVGTLRPQLDALDAYRASMNMGTLSGAPKLEATRLLRQAEGGVRRGSYGGAVGYLAGNGDLDTCITIRSGFVQGGRCVVQAGAGVVRDSDPQAETRETAAKARAVLLAVACSREQSEYQPKGRPEVAAAESRRQKAEGLAAPVSEPVSRQEKEEARA